MIRNMRPTLDRACEHTTDDGLPSTSNDAPASESDSQKDKIRTLEASLKDVECFKYGLLHDLRAPMLAIDGYASLLAQDCAAQLKDEARRHLQIIQDRCRRINRLIEAHRSYARLNGRPINCVEVDMPQLAKSAEMMSCATIGARHHASLLDACRWRAATAAFCMKPS